jgi:phosphoribosylaminoimidazole-succinocarboxamide synthase
VSISLSGIKLYKKGKIRNIYNADKSLVIVATDRLSAFDFVLPDEIPDKGKILTRISLFWFDYFKNDIENHLISVDPKDYPEQFRQYTEVLENRSMLVKKAEVIPFECVARGYLEGSGWKDYQESGKVCGISLPGGLKRGDKLPEPIFTPATKAEEGHDINIDYNYVANEIGNDIASKLKEYTLSLYSRAAEYALGRGIIIADTKFEFGSYNGKIILIDEVITPDSSRFWPLDQYLEDIKWNKKPPVPNLPLDIIEKTRAKYIEAYIKLTGLKPDFIN